MQSKEQKLQEKKELKAKKKKQKTIILLAVCAVLVIAAVVLTVVLVNASNAKNDNAPTKISFKNAASYDSLKTLNGKKVSINGYMATSSPSDGSFLFLMNLPYQSCPFCKPNTSELANTIEVYPKKNQKFSYTSQAVKMTGTLVVADDPDEPFTDKYGYEFAFKIVDAEYKILKDSDLNIDVALWSKIAESDIITELNSMQDYIYFLSHWPSYCYENTTDKDGNIQYGSYMFPNDAKYLLEAEKGQFHYGTVDGYFDDLIAKIKKIDPENLSVLVENVEKAKAFAEKAKAELYNGNYDKGSLHYIEKFDTDGYQYTLTNAKALQAEYEAIYLEFSTWISSWEM